jgi:hypothetical protein
MASTNNNLPQNDHDSKKPRDDAEITLQDCKIYGEIGHTFKESHEQCSYCDTSHPLEECPMAMLLVPYATESIMFLLDVIFILRCNDESASQGWTVAVAEEDP